jgi:threonine synthase
VAASESELASALVCSGCGHRVGPDEPEPFGCPGRVAGDDIDHVLVRELSGPAPPWPRLDANAETHPFVLFRHWLHSWRVARAQGLSDEQWIELVRRLDQGVAEVDGSGFGVTPYGRADALSDALGFTADGGVFIKDETGNVSGSHKARHLMGLAIWLAVTQRAGLAGARPDAPLAIASCGNAALAAAVIARAAGRQLSVFVPSWADTAVVERLNALQAEVVTCERRSDDAPGDPCLHRFHAAVDGGALPFTCQGSENGLVVEGGCTLGWELLSQHSAGAAGPLDRIFIQVGGGTLASAVIQGLIDGRDAQALQQLPRVHAVQTEGAAPLARAWDRLVEESESAGGSSDSRGAAFDGELLRRAARRRSHYMWPWETEPVSAAEGILDDEAYDWVGVLAGLRESGGDPVVVSESHVRSAHELGRRHTGLDVCPTGTAGLAGLLARLEQGSVGSDERVAVLFTGHSR